MPNIYDTRGIFMIPNWA